MNDPLDSMNLKHAKFYQNAVRKEPPTQLQRIWQVVSGFVLIAILFIPALVIHLVKKVYPWK